MNKIAQPDLEAIIGGFDKEAPLNFYKVDTLIQRMLSRRKISGDPLKVRKSLWASAYMSALNYRNVRVLQSEAKVFLKSLNAALVTIGHTHRYELKDLNSALELSAIRGKGLSKLDRAIKERGDIADLLRVLNRSSEVISEFLKNYVARRPERRSNREDPFIRSFVEICAEGWERDFGAHLTKKDRSDFVGLLATALDDFKYPKTGEQKKSDKWLYDRVNKQLFWN